MRFKDLTEEQKGWHLSGFADGESYFLVRPNFRKTKKGFSRIVWQFRWGIQLRADDYLILEDIADYFNSKGCKITVSKRKRKKDVSAQASVIIEGFKNNIIVREHFRKFPLMSKKKKDFEIWSESLDYLIKIATPINDRFFREYTFEEVEIRAYLCSLCDKIRIGRIDPSMHDLGLNELLRRFGGQKELYTVQLLSFFLTNSVITSDEFNALINKYRVVI